MATTAPACCHGLQAVKLSLPSRTPMRPSAAPVTLVTRVQCRSRRLRHTIGHDLASVSKSRTARSSRHSIAEGLGSRALQWRARCHATDTARRHVASATADHNRTCSIKSNQNCMPLQVRSHSAHLAAIRDPDARHQPPRVCGAPIDSCDPGHILHVGATAARPAHVQHITSTTPIVLTTSNAVAFGTVRGGGSGAAHAEATPPTARAAQNRHATSTPSRDLQNQNQNQNVLTCTTLVARRTELDSSEVSDCAYVAVVEA